MPDQAVPPAGGLRPIDTGVLLLLGLLWLAATLWTAHATIASNAADPAVVASAAALALPVVVTASLLAGAAAGLAATGLRLARAEVATGEREERAGASPAARTKGQHGRSAALRRGLVGAGAGAACAVPVAGLILLTYGGGSSLTTLAATVGVAAVIGGGAAALRRPVLAAGITSTLCVFLTGVLASAFQSPLKSLFGAGDTLASQADAASWLSATTAAASGLVAGVIAYLYLRRRGPGLRWPGYPIAGATPGLMLLVAEGLTLLGGSRLFDVVSRLSENDRATLAYLDGARINQALTVGFIGAIVAMIGVGRTMRRPVEEDAGPAPAPRTGPGTAQSAEPAG